MAHRQKHVALAAALVGAALLAGCAVDPVRESAPDGQASMMRLARASFDNGAYASAAGFYRRAHNMEPKAFAPLLGLGKALARAGASEEAAEALRQAIALDPNDAEAHRLLGEVLIAIARPSLAVEELGVALAKKPDAQTYNALGVAHDMLGAYPAAETAYRAGLALDPANAALNTNFALSLAVTGKYEEAIRQLAPIALGPLATARQRQDLALIYGLAGERDKAREVASLDLDPGAVRQNLDFYERLRGLHDRYAIADALGLRRIGPDSSITAR